MKVLLDEDVPQLLLPVLRTVLAGHVVDHVVDRGWGGKKDVPLLRDARQQGYEVFVTNDRKQRQDPEEMRSIVRSGMHHVTYVADSGKEGLARAIASVVAAMTPVMVLLDEATEQQLVQITKLQRRRVAFTSSGVRESPYAPR